jgi:hypothetical protein
MTVRERPMKTTTTTLGVRMAQAIGARDASELSSLFTTPVVFRAVTPRRFWDAETPMGVVDIVLGTWFDPTKTITRIAALESGVVGDVERVSYRIEVEMDGQPTVIEQVAYYSQQHGQISELRLVCSGFRPGVT